MLVTVEILMQALQKMIGSRGEGEIEVVTVLVPHADPEQGAEMWSQLLHRLQLIRVAVATRVVLNKRSIWKRLTS